MTPDASTLRRRALTGVCVVVTSAVLPRATIGREADALYDGDRATWQGLADAVAANVRRDVGADGFHTGSARFDGEWALVSNQTAALGFAQVIHRHPSLRARYLPPLRMAVDHMLRPRTWAFGREAWGVDPLEHLDRDDGHAYLGYASLALGALRSIDPNTPHAALHDRLVDALARRLERTPGGALETYPGEAYPCDIASVVGAIGQHAALTGRDRGALLTRMAAVYRRRWRDPASGYLVQTVAPREGAPTSPPRASGTALAAYFLSFADAGLARELGAPLGRVGHAHFLGFGGVREYPPGVSGGGDIDSGPVLFGVSVSATGFALSTARQLGDRARYQALYRTAALFGVPHGRGGAWHFLTGGTLGDALLFAMLTARTP